MSDVFGDHYVGAFARAMEEFAGGIDDYIREWNDFLGVPVAPPIAKSVMHGILGEYPEADDTKVAELTKLFIDDAENTTQFIKEMQEAAEGITLNWSSDGAANSFSQIMSELAQSGNDLVETKLSLAQGSADFYQSTILGKNMYIANLVMLAAELIRAIVMALPSWGVSLGTIPLSFAAARTAMRTMAERLMTAVSQITVRISLRELAVPTGARLLHALPEITSTLGRAGRNGLVGAGRRLGTIPARMTPSSIGGRLGAEQLQRQLLRQNIHALGRGAASREVLRQLNSRATRRAMAEQLTARFGGRAATAAAPRAVDDMASAAVRRAVENGMTARSLIGKKVWGYGVRSALMFGVGADVAGQAATMWETSGQSSMMNYHFNAVSTAASVAGAGLGGAPMGFATNLSGYVVTGAVGGAAGYLGSAGITAAFDPKVGSLPGRATAGADPGVLSWKEFTQSVWGGAAGGAWEKHIGDASYREAAHNFQNMTHAWGSLGKSGFGDMTGFIANSPPPPAGAGAIGSAPATQGLGAGSSGPSSPVITRPGAGPSTIGGSGNHGATGGMGGSGSNSTENSGPEDNQNGGQPSDERANTATEPSHIDSEPQRAESEPAHQNGDRPGQPEIARPEPAAGQSAPTNGSEQTAAHQDVATQEHTQHSSDQRSTSDSPQATVDENADQAIYRADSSTEPAHTNPAADPTGTDTAGQPAGGESVHQPESNQPANAEPGSGDTTAEPTSAEPGAGATTPGATPAVSGHGTVSVGDSVPGGEPQTVTPESEPTDPTNWADGAKMFTAREIQAMQVDGTASVDSESGVVTFSSTETGTVANVRISIDSTLDAGHAQFVPASFELTSSGYAEAVPAEFRISPVVSADITELATQQQAMTAQLANMALTASLVAHQGHIQPGQGFATARTAGSESTRDGDVVQATPRMLLTSELDTSISEDEAEQWLRDGLTELQSGDAADAQAQNAVIALAGDPDDGTMLAHYRDGTIIPFDVGISSDVPPGGIRVQSPQWQNHDGTWRSNTAGVVEIAPTATPEDMTVAVQEATRALHDGIPGNGGIDLGRAERGFNLHDVERAAELEPVTRDVNFSQSTEDRVDEMAVHYGKYLQRLADQTSVEEGMPIRVERMSQSVATLHYPNATVDVHVSVNADVPAASHQIHPPTVGVIDGKLVQTGPARLIFSGQGPAGDGAQGLLANLAARKAMIELGQMVDGLGNLADGLVAVGLDPDLIPLMRTVTAVPATDTATIRPDPLVAGDGTRSLSVRIPNPDEFAEHAGGVLDAVAEHGWQLRGMENGWDSGDPGLVTTWYAPEADQTVVLRMETPDVAVARARAAELDAMAEAPVDQSARYRQLLAEGRAQVLAAAVEPAGVNDLLSREVVQPVAEPDAAIDPDTTTKDASPEATAYDANQAEITDAVRDAAASVPDADVFVESERRSGEPVVSVHVPAENFTRDAQSIQDQLAASGYRLTGADLAWAMPGQSGWLTTWELPGTEPAMVVRVTTPEASAIARQAAEAGGHRDEVSANNSATGTWVTHRVQEIMAEMPIPDDAERMRLPELSADVLAGQTRTPDSLYLASSVTVSDHVLDAALERIGPDGQAPLTLQRSWFAGEDVHTRLRVATESVTRLPTTIHVAGAGGARVWHAQGTFADATFDVTVRSDGSVARVELVDDGNPNVFAASSGSLSPVSGAPLPDALAQHAGSEYTGPIATPGTAAQGAQLSGRTINLPFTGMRTTPAAPGQVETDPVQDAKAVLGNTPGVTQVAADRWLIGEPGGLRWELQINHRLGAPNVAIPAIRLVDGRWVQEGPVECTVPALSGNPAAHAASLRRFLLTVTQKTSSAFTDLVRTAQAGTTARLPVPGDLVPAQQNRPVEGVTATDTQPIPIVGEHEVESAPTHDAAAVGTVRIPENVFHADDLRLSPGTENSPVYTDPDGGTWHVDPARLPAAAEDEVASWNLFRMLAEELRQEVGVAVAVPEARLVVSETDAGGSAYAVATSTLDNSDRSLAAELDGQGIRPTLAASFGVWADAAEQIISKALTETGRSEGERPAESDRLSSGPQAAIARLTPEQIWQVVRFNVSDPRMAAETANRLLAEWEQTVSAHQIELRDRLHRASIQEAERARQEADAQVAEGAATRQEDFVARAKAAAARSAPLADADPERLAGPEPTAGTTEWHLWHAVTTLETTWLRAFQAGRANPDRVRDAVIANLYDSLCALGPMVAEHASTMANIQTRADFTRAAQELMSVSAAIRLYNADVAKALEDHDELRDLLPDQPVEPARWAELPESSEQGPRVAQTARMLPRKLADGTIWVPEADSPTLLRNPSGPALLDPLDASYAGVIELGVFPYQEDSWRFTRPTQVLLTALYGSLLEVRGVHGDELTAELSGYVEFAVINPVKQATNITVLDALGETLFNSIGLGRASTVESPGGQPPPADFAANERRLRWFYGDRLNIHQFSKETYFHVRMLARIPDHFHGLIADYLRSGGGSIHIGTGSIQYVGDRVPQQFSALHEHFVSLSHMKGIETFGVFQPWLGDVVIGSPYTAEFSPPGQVDGHGAAAIVGSTTEFDATKQASHTVSHEFAHLLDALSSSAANGGSMLSNSAEWHALYEVIRSLPRHQLNNYVMAPRGLVLTDPEKAFAQVSEAFAELAGAYVNDMTVGDSAEQDAIGLGELFGVDKPAYPPEVVVSRGTAWITAWGGHARGLTIKVDPSGVFECRDADGTVYVVGAEGATSGEGRSAPGVAVRENGRVLELSDWGDDLDDVAHPLVFGTRITAGSTGITIVAADGTRTAVGADGGVTVRSATEGDESDEPALVAEIAPDGTARPVAESPSPFGSPRGGLTVQNGRADILSSDGNVRVIADSAGTVQVLTNGNRTPSGMSAFEVLEQVRAFMDQHLTKPAPSTALVNNWLGLVRDTPTPLGVLSGWLSARASSHGAGDAVIAQFDKRRIDELAESWITLRRTVDISSSVGMREALSRAPSMIAETTEWIDQWRRVLSTLAPEERFSARVALEQARLSGWARLASPGDVLGPRFLDRAAHGDDPSVQLAVTALVQRFGDAGESRWASFARSARIGENAQPDGVTAGDIVRLVAAAEGRDVPDGPSLMDRIRSGLPADLVPQSVRNLEMTLSHGLSETAQALRGLRRDLADLRSRGIHALPTELPDAIRKDSEAKPTHAQMYGNSSDGARQPSSPEPPGNSDPRILRALERAVRARMPEHELTVHAIPAADGQIRLELRYGKYDTFTISVRDSEQRWPYYENVRTGTVTERDRLFGVYRGFYNVTLPLSELDDAGPALVADQVELIIRSRFDNFLLSPSVIPGDHGQGPLPNRHVVEHAAADVRRQLGSTVQSVWVSENANPREMWLRCADSDGNPFRIQVSTRKGLTEPKLILSGVDPNAYRLELPVGIGASEQQRAIAAELPSVLAYRAHVLDSGSLPQGGFERALAEASRDADLMQRVLEQDGDLDLAGLHARFGSDLPLAMKVALANGTEYVHKLYERWTGRGWADLGDGSPDPNLRAALTAAHENVWSQADPGDVTAAAVWFGFDRGDTADLGRFSALLHDEGLPAHPSVGELSTMRDIAAELAAARGLLSAQDRRQFLEANPGWLGDAVRIRPDGLTPLAFHADSTNDVLPAAMTEIAGLSNADRALLSRTAQLVVERWGPDGASSDAIGRIGAVIYLHGLTAGAWSAAQLPGAQVTVGFAGKDIAAELGIHTIAAHVPVASGEPMTDPTRTMDDWLDQIHDTRAGPREATIDDLVSDYVSAVNAVDQRVTWVKWFAERLAALEDVLPTDPSIADRIARALELPHEIVASLAVEEQLVVDPPPAIAVELVRADADEVVRLFAEHNGRLAGRADEAHSALVEQTDLPLELLTFVDDPFGTHDPAHREVSPDVARRPDEATKVPSTRQRRLAELTGARSDLYDAVAAAEPARNAAEADYFTKLTAMREARAALVASRSSLAPLLTRLATDNQHDPAWRVARNMQVPVRFVAMHSTPIADAPIPESALRMAERETGLNLRGSPSDVLSNVAEHMRQLKHELNNATHDLRAVRIGRNDAHRNYIEALTQAMTDASDSGITINEIAKRTRLNHVEVSSAIGRVVSPGRRETTPDHEIPLVDTHLIPMAKAWDRLWQPHWDRLLGRSDVVGQAWEGAERFRFLDPFSPNLSSDLTALGVYPPVAEALGSPTDPYLGSDVHAHFEGYEGPYNRHREGSYGSMFGYLQEMGHDGRTLMSGIRERGFGLASGSGGFYYGLAGVVYLGITEQIPMLELQGKFADLQMIETVRKLPPEFQWRAMVGPVSTRWDLPGALGNDLALLMAYGKTVKGEQTGLKEMVARMLGREENKIYNPKWTDTVGKLVGAAVQIRQDLADGTLGRGKVENVAPELINVLYTADGELRDGGQVSGREAVEHLDSLVAERDGLHTLLTEAGREKYADSLPDFTDGVPDMFNPHFIEKMRGDMITGQASVLHQDSGAARIMKNGLFQAGPSDERGLVPLAALFAQHPEFADNKLIWAHAATSNWVELTAGHVDWMRRVLDLAPGLKFDISWNPVAQHLFKHPDAEDALLRLINDYPDRFVFGSDAIRPQASPHATRHWTEMESFFRRIKTELPDGERIYWMVVRSNFDQTIDAADADGAQRFVDEYFSETWDEVFKEFPSHIQDEIHGRARRLVMEGWVPNPKNAVGPEGHLAGLANAKDGRAPADAWRDNVQLLSLITAHDLLESAPHRMSSAGKVAAVDVIRRTATRVVEGGRSLLARKDLKAPNPDEAGALEMGTTEGVVAAKFTQVATQDLVSADERDDAVDTVYRDVNQVTTDEFNGRKVVERLRQHRRPRRWIAWAVAVPATVGVGLAGAFAIGPVAGAPVAVAAGIGAVGFGLRGLLSAAKGLHGTKTRLYKELLVERCAFDDQAAMALARFVALNKDFDINPGGKKFRKTFEDLLVRGDEEFIAATREFAMTFEAIRSTPLGHDNRIDRARLATTVFSRYTDLLKRKVLGHGDDSASSLSPHAGWAGKTFNSMLAGTYLINLYGHAMQSTHATGLEQWVGTGYLITDSVFLLGSSLPSVIGGWLGYDNALRHIYRLIHNVIAYPALTVVNVGLTANLFMQGLGPNLANALVATTMTAASAYLSKLGIQIEFKTGRAPSWKGAAASATLSLSLLSFSVLAMSHSPLAIAVGLGLTAASPALLVRRWWITNHSKSEAPFEYRSMAEYPQHGAEYVREMNADSGPASDPKVLREFDAELREGLAEVAGADDSSGMSADGSRVEALTDESRSAIAEFAKQNVSVLARHLGVQESIVVARIEEKTRSAFALSEAGFMEAFPYRDDAQTSKMAAARRRLRPYLRASGVYDWESERVGLRLNEPVAVIATTLVKEVVTSMRHSPLIETRGLTGQDRAAREQEMRELMQRREIEDHAVVLAWLKEFGQPLPDPQLAEVARWEQETLERLIAERYPTDGPDAAHADQWVQAIIRGRDVVEPSYGSEPDADSAVDSGSANTLDPESTVEITARRRWPVQHEWTATEADQLAVWYMTEQWLPRHGLTPVADDDGGVPGRWKLAGGEPVRLDIRLDGAILTPAARLWTEGGLTHVRLALPSLPAAGKQRDFLVGMALREFMLVEVPARMSDLVLAAETEHAAPVTAADTFDPAQRDNDFWELREKNRQLRADGIAEVGRLHNKNPGADALRQPHQRTLLTARFHSGQHTSDMYTYSGTQQEWPPASEAPNWTKNERIFGTTFDGAYRPELGMPDPYGKFNRLADAEVKMLEELVRAEMARHSGLERSEIDDIVQQTAGKIRRDEAAGLRDYSDGFSGQLDRARDMVEDVLLEINISGARHAAAQGVQFMPVARDDLSGQLRVVVDLPSAKRDRIPLHYQICASCKGAIVQFKRLFPNVAVEAVNIAGERLM